MYEMVQCIFLCRYVCFFQFSLFPAFLLWIDPCCSSNFYSGKMYVGSIIFLGIDKSCTYNLALPRRAKDGEASILTTATSTNWSLFSHNFLEALTSSQPNQFHYRSTRQALHGSSVFVRNTHNRFIYIPPYNDVSWKAVEYFPWSDSLNYSVVCNKVLKRITRNGTYYIISGSFNGGLGHKYLSVFYSITYAILLGRRFLRIVDAYTLTRSPSTG